MSFHIGCIILRAQLPSEEYIMHDSETQSNYVIPDVIEQINNNLSDNVKVFNMLQTKKKLDVRKNCTARIYEYYLPLDVFNTFVEDQTSLNVHDEVVSNIVNKLNTAFSYYIGNKRINSFTKNKGAHHVRLYARAKLRNDLGNEKNVDSVSFNYDGEEKNNIYIFSKDELIYRAIYKFFCDTNIVSIGDNNNKYLRIELCGESFVYNQIRYMIGLAVAFVNGKIPLQYLEMAINGRVGLLLPKAPANGLLLKSYAFNPKINIIVNEAQRSDIFGIKNTEKEYKKPKIVLHNRRHDRDVHSFFKSVILPGINNDIKETLNEWEVELVHGLPSKEYCNLLYTDYDEFIGQRKQFLKETLINRMEEEKKFLSDKTRREELPRKTIAYKQYPLLYTSLITRYDRLPGAYIDEVYKAVLYDLQVTHKIYKKIPPSYLPSTRTGYYSNNDEMYINHLKLNNVICDIIDENGVDYYAKRGAPSSALPKPGNNKHFNLNCSL